MSNSYYIAACAFTERFPELSDKIQQYIKQQDIDYCRHERKSVILPVGMQRSHLRLI